MTNATAPNECKPTEGPLADDELNAVSAGMFYIKPTGGVSDGGIQSLVNTLVDRLGNALGVGGENAR